MAVGGTSDSARLFLAGVAANAWWMFVTLVLGGIAAAIGGAFSTTRTVVLSATGDRATLHPAA